jgi:hypothetical protein
MNYNDQCCPIYVSLDFNAAISAAIKPIYELPRIMIKISQSSYSCVLSASFVATQISDRDSIYIDIGNKYSFIESIWMLPAS